MVHDQAEKEKNGSAHPRLRLSSVVAVFFLAIAALSLAYIGGVMVGRDSCPVPVTEVVREDAPPEEKAASEEESPDTQKILAAEELEFARVLRGEKKRLPKASQPEANYDEKKREATADAQQTVKPEAKTDAPVASPAEASVSPVAAGGLFDYVFQVGVFGNEAGADNLRQKLEGFGLRTGMEKNGKLCIVLVRLRGDEARAAEVVKIAHELKLGEPVQRSRKPVN